MSNKTPKQTYRIGIKHEAFGAEGEREYVGTERGAIMAANKMAKSGGHGWRGVVRVIDGCGDEWIRR
jgi:hypothetical protein